MIPYLRLVVILILLSAGTVNAQLREFEITPVQNNRIPVFRDHPDMAAVIVNSSLTNLRLESNLEIVAILGNPNQGEYILIVRPVRQIITVNAPGFQQGRVTIAATEPRQVLYYRVEPKPEVATNVIPTIVQITPTDAKVTIDGNLVDISKPVPIEIGTHRIRIEKQGFRTIEKEVRISADQNLIRETLSAIEVVPMTIKTQPAGATILIDGVQVGVTDRNGDLGLFRFPGTYEMGMQLSGYLPETRTITVSETGSNAFSGTLIRNAGTLRLLVTPSDATVLINREKVDIRQPIDLVPGRIQVEISRDDHEPILETMEIIRGQTLSRTMSLVPHTGSLDVSAQPQGSVWTLTNANGQVVERGSSGMVREGLRVGNYTLTLTSPGFETVSEAIRIVNNQTTRRTVALKIPIRIRSNPSGSTITVDGQRMGETDQAGFLDALLLPGSYQILMQKSGYLDQTMNFDVSVPGQKTMAINLVRNAGTLRLSVTPANATVLLNRQPVDVSQPIELAPGLVQIEVRKVDHELYSETVEIQRGLTVSRNISLEAHLGGLQITTTPINATWSLSNTDGRIVASGSGMSRKTGLLVGNYTLTVKAVGHQDHTESIRIIRDQVLEKNVALSDGPPPCTGVNDIDGNCYTTVRIENQVWMAENLRTSKYRDGTTIPNVTDNSQWGYHTKGAWAHYNNQTTNETKYGKLYNGYAVADSRNLCPTGWHVPSDAEWTVLSNHLGSEPGFKMKSTTGWGSNGNGSNESGFNGLPGGSRGTGYGAGDFVGGAGEFWSSSKPSSGYTSFRYLRWDRNDLLSYDFYDRLGLSVRCIRD